MAEYIRFVIASLDPHSHRQQGIFQAAYGLLRDIELNDIDRAALRRVLNWFHANLCGPPEPPDSAIFWFKASGSETVRRMWELANILRSHGHHVDLIRTNKPGYIVFEDDVQIAAIPFQDTGI